MQGLLQNDGKLLVSLHEAKYNKVDYLFAKRG